jgi:hypothetical protein
VTSIVFIDGFGSCHSVFYSNKICLRLTIGCRVLMQECNPIWILHFACPHSLLILLFQYNSKSSFPVFFSMIGSFVGFPFYNVVARSKHDTTFWRHGNDTPHRRTNNGLKWSEIHGMSSPWRMPCRFYLRRCGRPLVRGVHAGGYLLYYLRALQLPPFYLLVHFPTPHLWTDILCYLFRNALPHLAPLIRKIPLRHSPNGLNQSSRLSLLQSDNPLS